MTTKTAAASSSRRKLWLITPVVMIATLLGASPAHAATVNVTVSCTANTNFTANDGDNIVFTFSSGCTNDSQLFTWKAWITNGDWLTPTSVGASIPSGTQLEKTLVPGNSSRNAGDTVAFVVPDINSASSASSFQIIWQGATPVNSATPTISSHPTGSTKTVGTQLTLSVVATASDGGTLTYQWKKGGNDILGATSANFTIQAVSLSDAGVYTVVVTNTHLQDEPVSTTSNSATIAVEAAPEPESPEDDSDTPSASKTASAGDITFSSGTSVLSAATKKSLKATVKKAGKSASFEVTGAASQLSGVSDKAVKALALKRASVIKSYLVSLGVKSSKITLKTKVIKQGKKPKVSVIASY
jgi:outer membrane protein OmpA-like peptidoglycan-associated protein